MASTEKTKHRMDTELEDLQLEFERVNAAAIVADKRAQNFDKVQMYLLILIMLIMLIMVIMVIMLIIMIMLLLVLVLMMLIMLIVVSL